MKTKILADFQIWISVPLILTQKCDGVILSTLSMVIFLFFFFLVALEDCFCYIFVITFVHSLCTVLDSQHLLYPITMCGLADDIILSWRWVTMILHLLCKLILQAHQVNDRGFPHMGIISAVIMLWSQKRTYYLCTNL